MLPNHRILQIKYFTARVSARPHDPDQPVRQQTYLRALRTLPNITIIYGHFLSHEVVMPLASAPGQFARVIKTEEKGSDVNLATHLLHDAYQNAYEAAVVISNDSDLLEPIRVVGKDMGKIVGILNPQQRPSRVLHANVPFFKQIRSGVLAASQFPTVLNNSNGTFNKPTTW
jgi:uncharacterized LabA/DUF88 family protein